MEELNTIPVDPTHPDLEATIGVKIPSEMRSQVIDFLK